MLYDSAYTGRLTPIGYVAVYGEGAPCRGFL